METRDWYAILGVLKDATAEEIRRAYRALAMQYHPDRAGDNPATTAAFHDVTEAYAVLGDERHRRQYDRGCAAIRSVRDLFVRNDRGRRYAAMMLMHGGTQAQDGMDMAFAVPVTEEQWREGGTVTVTLGGCEYVLAVPEGVTRFPWCRVRGGGEEGHGGGAPGDALILVFKRKERVDG